VWIGWIMFHKQDVKIYVISNCSDCEKAVTFLEKCDVSLEVCELERGSDALRDLTDSTGCSSFPIIFTDSVFTGGMEVIDNACMGMEEDLGVPRLYFNESKGHEDMNKNFEFSSEIFKKRTVEIYTIPDCTYCDRGTSKIYRGFQ